MQEALEKLTNLEHPVPVILGGFVNGLGLARSFGRVGIPTICLDIEKNMTFYSKYATGFICPDPVGEEEQFIAFLIEIGKKLKKKGIFFATNDIWLFPVCRRRMELEEYFHFPMSEWATIERCLDKSLLYDLAGRFSIPYPKTISVQSVYELDKYRDQIPYPCILKPSITVGFLEKLGSEGRTIRIDDKADLNHWIDRLISAGLEATPLIIQEEITGGVENLYTITSYSTNEGEIRGYSIGHKIRQSPPAAGTIRSGKLEHRNEVIELGRSLIKALRFHGIANTEFKYDEKEQCFKLIEINPRPGMWNLSALESGVNLPYMAYCDVTGVHYSGPVTGSEGKVWIFFPSDFITAVFNKYYSNKTIFTRVTDWYRSLDGEWIFAVESREDMMPAFFHYISILVKWIKR